MLSSNNKITGKQLQKLILLNSLSMGVLFFPRRAALFAGQDGWLIAVGLTLVALAVAGLYSLAEKAARQIPAVVAYPCAVLLCGKLILCAGLELRVFAMVARGILLQNTPEFITVGAMTLVCAYAAAKGIEARARVCEILWPVTAFVLAVFFITALFDVDFSNLKPAFTAPPGQILNGTLRLGYILAPLECLPFAVQKYAAKRENGRVYRAIALSGLMLTLLTAASVCKFGGGGTAAAEYPVLKLMDLIRFPGSLIERQDAIMFSFWIIAVFAVCGCYLHCGAALLGGVFRARAVPLGGSFHARAVLICAACAFGVSFIPINQGELEIWLDKIYLTTGIFFMLILPVAVIFAGFFKNGKGRAAAAVITALILLSGCRDGVAVENRAFVTVIAVDKAAEAGGNIDISGDSVSSGLSGGVSEPSGESRYIVSLIFPSLKKDAEDGIETETVSVKSLWETTEKLNAQTDKSVYLGQAKILLLGRGLLADGELLREALSALDGHADINRQMVTLAADGEASAGDASFLLRWFKNKTAAQGITYRLDFLRLQEAVSGTGDIVIPSVKLTGKPRGGGISTGDEPHTGDGAISTGDEPRLSGGVVLKNAELSAVLNGNETRGFLWGMPNQCEGAVITADGGKSPFVYKVKKHNARVSFEENNGRLTCKMKVDITGEAYPPDGSAQANPEPISAAIKTVIKNELASAFEKAKAARSDIFNLKDSLRKDAYALYQKYSSDWDKTLAEMEFLPILSES